MKNPKSEIPCPWKRSGFTGQNPNDARDPKTETRGRAITAFFLLLSALCFPAFAQGTAFTYQGRLDDGVGQASGIYDLRFTIFDVASGGTQQGDSLTNAAVTVSNGLFTVALDFGPGVFTGADRWLEIAVRTNGGGDFTALTPRQKITAAPYAIYAGGAATAATATSVPWLALSGVPPGLADGVDDNTLYSPGSGLNLAGTIFSLDINFTDPRYWKLTGNAGTTPGVNFLGTTDNQALELKANNARALRLEPTTNSPNVIGGWERNYVAPGVVGATIAGGGGNDFDALPQTNQVSTDFSTVAGGLGNRITFGVQPASGIWSAIGGGAFNQIDMASRAAIAGGQQNQIVLGADWAAIGGGWSNVVSSSDFATIAGGLGNHIELNSHAATIAGGVHHTIEAQANYASIGGGTNNVIQRGASGSTIGGGKVHTIGTNAANATIGGGTGNLIMSDTSASTIAGGWNNVIRTNSDSTVIAGGYANDIRESAQYASIQGGAGNTIHRGGFAATIGGGNVNTIQSNANNATISGGGQNIISNNADYATIGGGGGNRVETNAQYTTIAGGSTHTIRANASYASIGGGYANVISTDADYATVGGGYASLVASNADYATIPGGRYAAANNYGQLAYASGRFAATGDAQTSTHVLRRTTTTTNLTELFLDGSSRRMTVPTDGVWTFDLIVVAASSTDYAGYQIRGVIGNFAGFIALLGTPVKTVLYESDSTWDVTVGADLATSTLTVRVRGAAGQTIRWVVSVRTVEVIL